KAEIDIAIGHSLPGEVDSRGLMRERLFHDEICAAFLAPSHPLAREHSLFLRDLEDVPFLFPPRSHFPATYDAVFRQFALAGTRPRIEGEYDGLVTGWALAAQGMGWTLAWRGVMDEPPEGLKAVWLRDFHLPWGAEIVYRADEWRAPILTAVDALRDCARHLFPSL